MNPPGNAWESAIPPSSRHAPRLLVGTSGYSYPEWVEAGFYPPGTRPAHMLPLYAQRFPVTELNFTWYQMPRPEAMARLEAQAPPGFRFAAKLTRTLTHEVDPSGWQSQAAAFRQGMAPLIQRGRLLAVLIQFSRGFRRSPENRRYLAALLDQLAGLPLAVEFRHASWAADRVYDELSRRRVALVALDRPDVPGLFPMLTTVTCPDLFYARFHGRNLKGWRSGNMAQQFDYHYSDDELREWAEDRIEKMAAQAPLGLLFFNNHVRGQAAANAASLARMLGERGLTPPPPCPPAPQPCALRTEPSST